MFIGLIIRAYKRQAAMILLGLGLCVAFYTGIDVLRDSVEMEQQDQSAKQWLIEGVPGAGRADAWSGDVVPVADVSESMLLKILGVIKWTLAPLYIAGVFSAMATGIIEEQEEERLRVWRKWLGRRARRGSYGIVE